MMMQQEILFITFIIITTLKKRIYSLPKYSNFMAFIILRTNIRYIKIEIFLYPNLFDT